MGQDPIFAIEPGAVKEWDELAILKWLNESILALLDGSLRLGALSSGDPTLPKLERREQAGRECIGLKTLENLRNTIAKLHASPGVRSEDQEDQISTFERSVLKLNDAADREAAARSAASESIFRDVWKSAKRCLDSDLKLDRCPVCGTEFAKSPSESRVGVCERLHVSLKKLDGYRQAKEAKEKAEETAAEAAKSLDGSLDVLRHLPGWDGCGSVTAYHDALKSWKAGEAMPDSSNATGELERLYVSVSGDMERMGQRQDRHTYGSALKTICDLLEIKANLGRIDRIRDELEAVSDSLVRQTLAFNNAIVKHIGSKIQSLEDKAREIYRTIQDTDDAPRIKIRLAGEDKDKKREASLSIDFHDREEVAPGSYLSNSQLHTLALSIRLAAIREFNTGFKVIALDDIVTSYDADHRLTIVTVLNEDFADFQIILTTHDEQFFKMLNGQLGQRHWDYKQISRLRPDGPVFKKYRTPPEEVEARLKSRKDAGNLIRQVEEEWLSQICYDFKTPTTFTTREPTLHDLAESLSKFLSGARLILPNIPSCYQQFLDSMKTPEVENLGSHFRNSPYAARSSGDERARWKNFKAFQDLFKCPKCGKRRFKRPENLEKPVCRSCETPFNFGSQDQT